MGTRGNIIARMVKNEMEQLENQLIQLTTNNTRAGLRSGSSLTKEHELSNDNDLNATYSGQNDPQYSFFGDLDMHWCFSSEQLVQVANSLEIDDLVWSNPDGASRHFF